MRQNDPFNLKGRKQDKKNKNKKYGRNLAKCKRYHDEGRREKNQERRLRRILKGYRKVA